MTSRLTECVFDCANLATLSRFWAGALGYQVLDESADWSRSAQRLWASGSRRLQSILGGLGLQARYLTVPVAIDR